ncbi:MAG: low molecular weight phosphatase family protein [Nocardioidaceae bacterium]|nr:low molecular weight phosphatase family protein [Nocardioidaceae bacterium]
MSTPGFLFVCARNGGKSPMAAALLTRAVGGRAHVASAGTEPGTAVNALSAEVLAEQGVDIGHHVPRGLTDEMVARADVVVVLGREADLRVDPDVRLETWELDEPSDRGVDGIERMRLVRDEIDARVRDLATRWGVPVD